MHLFCSTTETSPSLSTGMSPQTHLFEVQPPFHDPAPASFGRSFRSERLFGGANLPIPACQSSGVGLFEASPLPDLTQLWATLHLRPRPQLIPPLSLCPVHGQFSMAVRGCGSGLPGKNDRGLDLHGLLAFIQLQQCAQDRCNAKLNLTSRALDPAGPWGRGRSCGGGATFGPAKMEAEPGVLGLGWVWGSYSRAGPRGSRRDFLAVGTRRLRAGAGLLVGGVIDSAGGGHALGAGLEDALRFPNPFDAFSSPGPPSQVMRVHTRPTAWSATAVWA